MGRTTKEINKITGAIISTSIRLILCSLVVLLLYEGATRGYAFGYEIFSPTAVAAAPGIEKIVTIEKKNSESDIARMLEKKGLIKNAYIFMIQCKFYDYEILPGTYELNTSLTSLEILKKIHEDGVKAQKEAEEISENSEEETPEEEQEVIEG